MTRFATLVRQARRSARRAGAGAAVLPLSTSLDALGSQGWADEGLRDVPVDRIVGTVARAEEFDRELRPTRRHLRHRWQRVADGVAAGRSLPPPQLIRLGELYFVADGHHRVSVARASGIDVVEAHVRRVCTVAYACHCLTLLDLPSKRAERRFLERFPLPDDVREWLWLDDPSDWTLVERAAQEWIDERASGTGPVAELSEELVRAWWEQDVLPTSHACRGHERADLEEYLCAVRERVAADACVC